MSRGVLAVVSGFSGAGKGTIMKKPDGEVRHHALSVSATTRNPRPGKKTEENTFPHKKKNLRK